MSATKTQTITEAPVAPVAAPAKRILTPEQEAEKIRRQAEAKAHKEATERGKQTLVALVAVSEARREKTEAEIRANIEDDENDAKRLDTLNHFREKYGMDTEGDATAATVRLNLDTNVQLARSAVASQIADFCLGNGKAKTIATNQMFIGTDVPDLVALSSAFGMEEEMQSAIDNADGAGVVNLLKAMLSARQSLATAKTDIEVANRTVDLSMLKLTAKHLPKSDVIKGYIRRFLAKESECAKVLNGFNEEAHVLADTFKKLATKGTVKQDELAAFFAAVKAMLKAELISKAEADTLLKLQLDDEGQLTVQEDETRAFFGFDQPYMQRYLRRENPQLQALLVELRVVVEAWAESQGMSEADGSITTFTNGMMDFLLNDPLGRDQLDQMLARYARWDSNECIAAGATMDKITAKNGKPMATAAGRAPHAVTVLTNPNPADRAAGIFPESRRNVRDRVVRETVELLSATEGGVVSTMEGIREALQSAALKKLGSIRKEFTSMNKKLGEEAEAKKAKAKAKKAAEKAAKEDEEEAPKKKVSVSKKRVHEEVEEEVEEEAPKKSKKSKKTTVVEEVVEEVAEEEADADEEMSE